MFCVPSEHDDLAEKVSPAVHEQFRKWLSADEPNAPYLRAYAEHYGGNVRWTYLPRSDVSFLIRGTTLSALSSGIHDAYVYDRSMVGLGHRARVGIVEIISQLADATETDGTVEITFDWREKFEVADAIHFLWEFVQRPGTCESCRVEQTFRHREKMVYIDQQGMTGDHNLNLYPPKDRVTPPKLRLAQTWSPSEYVVEW
jgi:hypothetical protein